MKEIEGIGEGLHVFQTGEVVDGGRLFQTEQVVGVNRITGEELRRPATELVFEHGTDEARFTPDPGWNYAPRIMDFGPIDAPVGVLPALTGGKTGWKDLGLGPLSPRPAPRRLPPATPEPGETLADARKRVIGAALGIPPGGGVRVRTPDGLDDVVVTWEMIDHVVDDHPTDPRATCCIDAGKGPEPALVRMRGLSRNRPCAIAQRRSASPASSCRSYPRSPPRT